MATEKVFTWLGRLMAVASLFGSKGAKLQAALEQLLDSYLLIKDLRARAKESLVQNEALVLSSEDLVALDDFFDDAGSTLSRLNIRK